MRMLCARVGCNPTQQCFSCNPARNGRFHEASGMTKSWSRFLAAMVVGAGMMVARAQQPSERAPDLHKMVDDYLTGSARTFWEERAAKMAGIKTPADIHARQSLVRKTYIDLLGGFPERRPLHATITARIERPGYRIEKLIYQSQPGFYVTADVYVPLSGKAPYPAVLGTAGHSAGGKAEPTYQKAWISLARRGYVVLAFDEVGLGERVQYWDDEQKRSHLGIASAEHTVMGMQSLLVGINLGMYVAWDGIRGMDYLLSRADVDPRRIAVIGNSGGGHQSALIAMVDERLAVAVPSCWLTSSKALWEQFIPQDAEQNVAGFLSHGLDYGDFALSFAPKPFLFATATQDFFPIAGAHATFAEDQMFYKILGQPEHLGFFEYDDTHGWSRPRREATYTWLGRWLQHQPDSRAEPDFRVEPESTLSATSSGQVTTSLHGKTIPTLTRERAERLAAARTHLDVPDLRSALAARLGIAAEDPAVPPPASSLGRVTHKDGYDLQEIVLETEPGIKVPSLLFLPTRGAVGKPAIIYADAAGNAAAETSAEIERLVRAGKIVIAPDLRGWGESASTGGKAPHTGRYETDMRALIVGRTMVGMQVTDLRRVVDYLLSRNDVDPHAIGVYGKGNGGIVALFSATLDARIGNVVCEDSLLSYGEMASTLYYDQSLFDVVVPGILKDLDLPDAAAAIAPRPLSIVNARSASGALYPLDAAEAVYATTAHAYTQRQQTEHFQMSAPALANGSK
jgi:cephalosporin-C deacetylase-like acetyl esterase